MKKIKAGIMGAAGYTGGELLRILVHHPETEIIFAHSESQKDKYVHEVHTDLLGDTSLKFTDVPSDDIDVLFLCFSHGKAREFMASYKEAAKVRVIDLSQDHRIANEEFVYGLPELNRELIGKQKHVANPGCFATCIQLALLPLAFRRLLLHDIHISATTGSTGAGQSLSATSHFSWRQNNLSIYKAFEHQHLAEIRQSIKQLQDDFSAEINFIPYRGSFTRGIIAGIYVKCEMSLEQLQEIYETYYSTHPFVHMSAAPVDLKQVVNTNKCLLHLEKHGNKLLISACIDNLSKGASGQAVQNMNLLFSLEETAGLKLKASYF